MVNIGFIDTSGREVIPLIYREVHRLSESEVAVCLNKKWSIVNKNHKQIVPFVYDSIKPFSCGLAPVKKGKKWGFINQQGKIEIPLVYEEAEVFDKNIAAVKLAGKWGMIDKKANWFIANEYQEIHVFTATIAVKQNKKWRYMNYAKEWADGNVYDSLITDTRIRINKPGYSFVFTQKSNKMGFVDSVGKMVVPNIYDEITCTNDDRFLEVTKGNKKGLFDRMGKLICPVEYEIVMVFPRCIRAASQKEIRIIPIEQVQEPTWED